MLRPHSFKITYLICIGALLVACDDNGGDSENEDNDSSTDADSDSDTDADTDADTDTDTDVDTDADSDSDTDTDTDADSDADGDGDWDDDLNDEQGEDGSKDNEGDKYEDVGTNAFVVVEHDPFSTFAADVDSASYDLFRRDINRGSLPRKESVRLEEYVNYFAYDYPTPVPEDEHPFSVSLAAAPDIFNNGTTLLRVGIQSELPPEFEKKQANVVFLIDVSGSMSGSDKLPLVKHVLTRTLDVLEDGDKISIVTYAANTGVRLEPTDISEKAKIKNVINSLNSGGSTAGASGINLAYNQAESAFVNEGINHVILCTDGDFNVGLSSDEDLVALIEEKRKLGITLTVLGFGAGNLNDSMMEKISNAGNGIYGVISSKDQADDYVEKRMLSNLVLIAKDMKIQVEFNPKNVKAYRLLGYENRAIADNDFRDDTVDAGEIGAGHRVTALYELVMEGGPIPEKEGAPELENGEPVEGKREINDSDMVLVKVRYKDVDATESDPAYEVSATMIASDIKTSHDDASADFKWAAAIAAFAEILKESPYADNEALSTIESIVTSKNWLNSDRAEFAALFKEAKGMIAQ